MTHKRIAAIAKLAAEFAWKPHHDAGLPIPSAILAHEFVTQMWDEDTTIDMDAIDSARYPKWWLYFKRVYDRTVENLNRMAI